MKTLSIGTEAWVVWHGAPYAVLVASSTKEKFALIIRSGEAILVVSAHVFETKKDAEKAIKDGLKSSSLKDLSDEAKAHNEKWSSSALNSFMGQFLENGADIFSKGAEVLKKGADSLKKEAKGFQG